MLFPNFQYLHTVAYYHRLYVLWCLCLFSQEHRWCFCSVPSSISGLSIYDDHWSSISNHSPDWCSPVLWWKAATCLLQQQFTPQKREIALLMSWGLDLNQWWAQEMSETYLFFLKFAYKCAISLEDNVFENMAVKIMSECMESQWVISFTTFRCFGLVNF